MKIFYVRPRRAGGYGSGDGRSFEDAWNGFQAIEWAAVAAAEPATVWVCGNASAPGSFTTVHVEASYLQQSGACDLEPQASPDPRREPAVAV